MKLRISTVLFFLILSTFQLFLVATDRGINIDGTVATPITLISNSVTGFATLNYTVPRVFNRNSFCFAQGNENADDYLDIEITPFTISQSGHYCLPHDLLISAAFVTAITVDASDVIIDLNGYKIDGGGFATTSGIVINPNRTNVLVTNGTIERCTTGISVSKPNSCIRIENITIKTCGTGIFFGLGAGFFDRITDSTIIDCTITESTASGVSLSNCTCMQITNVVANDNVGAGFTASACHECQYFMCFACRNRGEGGFVSRFGAGNIYDTCTAENNASGATGFGFAFGLGNSTENHSCIFDCLAKKNGIIGGVVTSTIGIGIEFTSTNRCVARNNNLIENEGTGGTSLGLRDLPSVPVSFSSIYSNFASGPLPTNYAGAIPNVLTLPPTATFPAATIADNIDVTT